MAGKDDVVTSKDDVVACNDGVVTPEDRRPELPREKIDPYNPR